MNTSDVSLSFERRPAAGGLGSHLSFAFFLCSLEPGSPDVSGEHLEGEALATNRSAAATVGTWTPSRKNEPCSAAWQTVSYFKVTGGTVPW